MPVTASSRVFQPMIPAGARNPAMLQPVIPMAIATERAATGLDIRAAAQPCPSSEGGANACSNGPYTLAILLPDVSLTASGSKRRARIRVLERNRSARRRIIDIYTW